MPKHCPENERIKHRYQTWLREAKRQSDASIDKAMSAIQQFEEHGRHRPFKRFHRNQAVAFKTHLNGHRNPRSGKPLSAATKHATLAALKAFFLWLADQQGYRSVVTYSDAEYFNASEHDRSVATAKREQPVPTPEQILTVLRSMPTTTDINLRDRALVAFIFLTGMRDGAVASAKLKHLDLKEGSVFHDPREMKTKFSKTFKTWFFPVGDEVRQIVEDWVRYLLEDKAWGQDDPLFPATRVVRGADSGFEAAGLARRHWSSASPIRQVFRTAFEQADLCYFNPHSFRKTLAVLGERLCRGPEEFKAWSQNLGHEDVLTTLRSYGQVPSGRQAEIIRNLAEPDVDRTGMLDDMIRSLEQLRYARTGNWLDDQAELDRANREDDPRSPF